MLTKGDQVIKTDKALDHRGPHTHMVIYWDFQELNIKAERVIPLFMFSLCTLAEMIHF